MIVPRLRSEARGGSSASPSTRYNSGVYAGRVQHGHDPDLKRALQYSYTSQAVRKWEKRWVTIHETSMRVQKWIPVPVLVPTHASQTTTTAEKSAILPKRKHVEKQEQLDTLSIPTQDTQMLGDDESTNQSSQN